ncbi:MAG: beta-ketoacyl synthase chain length factor [Ruminobacter sp.]|uniref:Beta-ketoacyl synthase, N-terminal domain n=1 Tax=Ruminobacter amylophilus TaxID=867 RepID=A0A662ZG40_9GAMM|nr:MULTISPECIES: beta-ketoacyl synthase chain length factor [Ruminobacter]MBQ3775593.1 beta-ketoacyl synthase chain length factor [Ruminobacter sp.]SFP04554.1 Beta-ketoacyl synthase, N-terminal domain [Ruminobacter amylophilus]
MSFRFNLKQVYFLSGYAHAYEELKKIQGSNYNHHDDGSIKELPVIKAIPMMMRRRLSSSGKMAVALSMEAFRHYEIDKVIFASRTGETKRCITLLRDVYMDNGVSPTEFSASVHNGNVGVFSIVSRFFGETTAVSAAEKTLGAAMAEAYASLYGEGKERVLIVVYEEDLSNNIMPIPESVFGNGSYACAAVLEKWQADISSVDELYRTDSAMKTSESDPETEEHYFEFDYGREGGMDPVDYFRELRFVNPPQPEPAEDR